MPSRSRWSRRMPLKPYEQDQGLMFPPHLGDLVPEDHLVRVVNEVVERLDCSAIDSTYSLLGRNAYHPRLLLKLLFFGYATGTRSSRAIARSICEVVPYMWLSGGQRPDFRTISDFRKNHLAAIQDLFIQVVRLCGEIGLVKVGHWSIDGTKVKANAGIGNSVTRETIESELAKLREEIGRSLEDGGKEDAAEDVLYGTDQRGDELPKEARRKAERAERLEKALKTLNEHKEREKANRTDPDAAVMKRKGGGFEPSYNPQITVDADSQVIVAADATDAQADNAQLLPQVNQAIENIRAKPQEVSADAGYTAGPVLQELENRHITPYIPQNENLEQKEPNETEVCQRRFTRADFRYDAEADVFVCPAGETLEYSQIKKRQQAGSYEVKVYKREGCEGCPLAARCLKPGSKTRSVELSPFENVQCRMKERLGTPEGKATYAKRKRTVEPVFGVMKAVMGFRYFLLRGLEAVRGEWRLAATAFNIRKLWAAFRALLASEAAFV